MKTNDFPCKCKFVEYLQVLSITTTMTNIAITPTAAITTTTADM
jgi:hypothetical protein